MVYIRISFRWQSRVLNLIGFWGFSLRPVYVHCELIICISTHSGIAESDKSTCLSNMDQTEKPPIPSNTHRSLGARTLNVQVSTLPFLQSCFHACLVFPFAVPLPLSPLALFPICGIKPWWYTYRSFSLFVLILFVSPLQRTEDSSVRFCGSVWGETEEAPRSSWKQAAYLYIEGFVNGRMAVFCFPLTSFTHFWTFKAKLIWESSSQVKKFDRW